LLVTAGEYVAPLRRWILDWASGLRLVKRRAELMDSSAGGMMAALIKFDREQLEQQISQTPTWCWLMTTVLLKL